MTTKETSYKKEAQNHASNTKLFCLKLHIYSFLPILYMKSLKQKQKI